MEWGGGGAVSSGKTDKCHLKRRYALTLWQFKLYVSDTKKLAQNLGPKNNVELKGGDSL